MSEDLSDDFKKRYPILAKDASDINREDLLDYLNQIQEEVLSLFSKEPEIAHIMMHTITLMIRLSIFNERNILEGVKESIDDIFPSLDDAAREQVEHNLGELDKRHKETWEHMGKRLTRVENWQDSFGSK